MSVWCRFSSCKLFLFIEERAHTEPRKMKRMDSTASAALQPLDLSTFWRSVHQWHLQRGHRYRGLTCAKGQRMLWRKGAFHSGPIAQLPPAACPVLIPDAMEVELNWCCFLSGEVCFASFLVTAYAKCSLTSSSSATCWKLSVSTQAGYGALVWGSIHLPQHEVKYSQTLTQRGAAFWGCAALVLLLLY